MVLADLFFPNPHPGVYGLSLAEDRLFWGSFWTTKEPGVSRRFPRKWAGGHHIASCSLSGLNREGGAGRGLLSQAQSCPFRIMWEHPWAAACYWISQRSIWADFSHENQMSKKRLPCSPGEFVLLSRACEGTQEFCGSIPTGFHQMWQAEGGLCWFLFAEAMWRVWKQITSPCTHSHLASGTLWSQWGLQAAQTERRHLVPSSFPVKWFNYNGSKYNNDQKKGQVFKKPNSRETMWIRGTPCFLDWKCSRRAQRREGLGFRMESLVTFNPDPAHDLWMFLFPCRLISIGGFSRAL